MEVPQKLYEAASDCICSTLFMCEDSPSYYTLAQILQAEVQKLLPVFQAAVQSEDIPRFGKKLIDFFGYILSMSRASALCRIFTEMAETFLYHMVHQSDIGLGGLYMLDLLLECVSHHDYEVCMYFNG